MKKIITITFLILLFLTQTFAQSAGTKKEETQQTTTTKGVEVEYDRVKDKTTISVIMGLTSSKTPSDNIIFGSIDIYSGKTRTTPTPDKVIVTFVSVSKQKQFSTSRSWIVLADDERIKLGSGEYVVEANESGAAEILLFALPVENIKKMIDAKKVEMQLGNKEFTLTESQLESLREYYKKLTN